MAAGDFVLSLGAFRVLVVIGGLFALAATSGYVVRVSLRRALGRDYDESIGNEVKDTGFVIGKTENVLVYVLIFAGAYTALALAFAAK